MLMDVLPVLGTKGTEKRANKTNWRKEEKKIIFTWSCWHLYEINLSFAWKSRFFSSLLHLNARLILPSDSKLSSAVHRYPNIFNHDKCFFFISNHAKTLRNILVTRIPLNCPFYLNCLMLSNSTLILHEIPSRCVPFEIAIINGRKVIIEIRQKILI